MPLFTYRTTLRVTLVDGSQAVTTTRIKVDETNPTRARASLPVLAAEWAHDEGSKLFDLPPEFVKVLNATLEG